MLSPPPLVGNEPDFVICVLPICERFWGSLRRECLDCLFILGERHLRHCVQEYVQYFNHARPHQGIAQAIPMPLSPPVSDRPGGEIISRPVLYGLHHDYQRRAA